MGRPRAVSDEQRRRGREWSDEEMLAFLRELQARHDGELRQEYLLQNRPRGRGIAPSRNAVIQRFGGWKRVCEMLNQPYRTAVGSDRYVGAISGRVAANRASSSRRTFPISLRGNRSTTKTRFGHL